MNSFSAALVFLGSLWTGPVLTIAMGNLWLLLFSLSVIFSLEGLSRANKKENN